MKIPTSRGGQNQMFGKVVHMIVGTGLQAMRRGSRDAGTIFSMELLVYLRRASGEKS